MSSVDDDYAHNQPGQGASRFDRQRFVKLCEMLASPVDAERATAALKATEMLRRRGWTWADVITSSTETPRQRGRPSFSDIFGVRVDENASGTGRRRVDEVQWPGGGHQFWRDVGDRQRERERSRRRGHSADENGTANETRAHNPRLRFHAGLSALDVVYAIYSKNPQLGEWESGFINNLMRQANTTRPQDFALTERQWERVIEIANRADLLRRVAISPETYALDKGDAQWARR